MSTLTDALTAHLNKREHPSGNDDTHAHASEAGMCARAIQYRVQRIPRTDPHPLTTLISFRIGSDLHLAVQEALKSVRPDIRLEVAWSQGQVSGHADGVYDLPLGRAAVVEIKTAGPFAWKYMTVPKHEHRLQASVNALAVGATHLHIIYLNIAAKSGEDPIREFVLPADLDAARLEIDRLQAIALQEEQADREQWGLILEPERTAFPCGYCSWFTQCCADGA